MVPSAKELVVFELLASGSELYGLQMVEASQGHLKRGTVYVTLSRMEQKGYLQSALEPAELSPAGPPRRLYRITPKGDRVLRAWQLMQSVLTLENG